MMNGIAKMLIVLGAVSMFLGVLVYAAGAIGIPLGRLPGDIFVEGKNSRFYFPVVTCIVLSVLMSALLYLWNSWK